MCIGPKDRLDVEDRLQEQGGHNTYDNDGEGIYILM